MENKNEILQELEEVSPVLIAASNNTPYSVLPAYFDNLAAEIETKIQSGIEPYYGFSQQVPYSVPENHFQGLPAIILERVILKKEEKSVFEEMAEISPLLNTINKHTIYHVPEGYFEKNNLGEGKAVEEGKVLSINNTRRFLRYAIAAIIIGLMVIGMFLYTGRDSNVEGTNVQTASEVNKLSEQEIIDFLKTTSPTENIVSTINNGNTKDIDIKTSVSKMTDTEISQFLQENGEQVEM